MTSSRPHAEASIAGDVVHEIVSQLQALPRKTAALDLLIVSNGGDATVAWRIVSLIREHVRTFSVLVPSGAFSAATLIALGADSIVIHANGNLGPVDPQLHFRRHRGQGDQPASIDFGSEDLSAFLSFAREEVRLKSEQHLADVFGKFCDDVGSVPIGVAARSAQLSLSMAEKLLCMHMSGWLHKRRAKAIARRLSREYYHHGYALSRSEAREIGLPVENSDAELDELVWAVWLDVANDLDVRVPFHPLRLVQANPACAALFGPVPSLAVPPGTPPQIAQAVMNNIAQQGVVVVPPTNYRLSHAIVESTRTASHFVVEGAVFAARRPDLELKFNVVPFRSGWNTVEVPGDIGAT